MGRGSDHRAGRSGDLISRLSRVVRAEQAIVLADDQQGLNSDGRESSGQIDMRHALGDVAER